MPTDSAGPAKSSLGPTESSAQGRDAAGERVEPWRKPRVTFANWPSPVTRHLFQKPRLIGRPPDDRLPDFPLVTEGIENATELPAVLDGHGGGLGRSRGHRLLNERMRIVDNEESTAGSPVDAAWIEALHGRRRRGDPEGSTPHRELGDDVIAFTYDMKRACTERRFVERDRFARFVNPKFRLDSRHEPRR
jgi:hypothetical protein